MRAKIKATGEIMKLADYARITLDACDSRGNPIELSPEEVELIPDLEPKRLYLREDNFQNINWEQRHYEIAKCAMPFFQQVFKDNYQFIAECAVKQADALIAELKKEKKEEKDNE